MPRSSDDDRAPRSGDGGFDSIALLCPACGDRLEPTTLRSETSVLRCPGCGQVVI